MKKRLEDMYGEVYSTQPTESTHHSIQEAYDKVYDEQAEGEDQCLFEDSLYEAVYEQRTINENGQITDGGIYEEVLLRELELKLQQESIHEQECDAVINEYAKHEPWLYANSTSAKKHGKSLMSMDRKHLNLKRQDYIQKDPAVERCNLTGSDQHLAGDSLMKTLANYNMDFEEGAIKGISKSGAAIFMFLDPTTGAPRGIIHKKDPNRVFFHKKQ